MESRARTHAVSLPSANANEPPRLSALAPAAPRQLDDLVAAMLPNNVDGRPQSMREIARALAPADAPRATGELWPLPAAHSGDDDPATARDTAPELRAGAPPAAAAAPGQPQAEADHPSPSEDRGANTWRYAASFESPEGRETPSAARAGGEGDNASDPPAPARQDGACRLESARRDPNPVPSTLRGAAGERPRKASGDLLKGGGLSRRVVMGASAAAGIVTLVVIVSIAMGGANPRAGARCAALRRTGRPRAAGMPLFQSSSFHPANQ